MPYQEKCRTFKLILFVNVKLLIDFEILNISPKFKSKNSFFTNWTGTNLTLLIPSRTTTSHTIIVQQSQFNKHYPSICPFNQTAVLLITPPLKLCAPVAKDKNSKENIPFNFIIINKTII